MLLESRPNAKKAVFVLTDGHSNIGPPPVKAAFDILSLKWNQTWDWEKLGPQVGRTSCYTSNVGPRGEGVFFYNNQRIYKYPRTTCSSAPNLKSCIAAPCRGQRELSLAWLRVNNPGRSRPGSQRHAAEADNCARPTKKVLHGKRYELWFLGIITAFIIHCNNAGRRYINRR